MSDENTTPETTATAASSAPETKETKAQGLLADVAARIKESGPEVYNRLRDAMVDKEVAERVSLLDKGLQKRFQLQTELRKVNKPDNETFNADGSLAAGTYSKARLEEIKKARESLEKHEKALELALASNDFGKLKESCK